MKDSELHFKKPEWWGPMHDQALANVTNQWKPRQDIHPQPYIVTDLVRLGVLEVERDPKSRKGHLYRRRPR